MRWLATTTMILALASTALAGPYEDGVNAQDRGDLAAAVRFYRIAAEEGNKYAQLSLGMLMAFGRGVQRDMAEAIKWYKAAAQQGERHSRSLLGAVYEHGEGVTGDLVRAHMWYSLAADEPGIEAGDLEAAAEDRDRVHERLTFAQREESRAMARRCRESAFKDCGY